MPKSHLTYLIEEENKHLYKQILKFIYFCRINFNHRSWNLIIDHSKRSTKIQFQVPIFKWLMIAHPTKPANTTFAAFWQIHRLHFLKISWDILKYLYRKLNETNICLDTQISLQKIIWNKYISGWLFELFKAVFNTLWKCNILMNLQISPVTWAQSQQIHLCW